MKNEYDEHEVFCPGPHKEPVILGPCPTDENCTSRYNHAGEERCAECEDLQQRAEWGQK